MRSRGRVSPATYAVLTVLLLLLAAAYLFFGGALAGRGELGKGDLIAAVAVWPLCDILADCAAGRRLADRVAGRESPPPE